MKEELVQALSDWAEKKLSNEEFRLRVQEIGADSWIRRPLRLQPFPTRNPGAVEYAQTMRRVDELRPRTIEERAKFQSRLKSLRPQYEGWYLPIKEAMEDLMGIVRALARTDRARVEQLLSIGSEIANQLDRQLQYGDLPWLPPKPRTRHTIVQEWRSLSREVAEPPF